MGEESTILAPPFLLAPNLIIARIFWHTGYLGRLEFKSFYVKPSIPLPGAPVSLTCLCWVEQQEDSKNSERLSLWILNHLPVNPLQVAGRNSHHGLLDQVHCVNDQPACGLLGKKGRGNYLCSYLAICRSLCQQKQMKTMPTLLSSLPPFLQGKLPISKIS